MPSQGSFSITNKTRFDLEIQLAQVGVLYWDFVPPSKTFYKETGAVHFTIKCRINLSKKSDTRIFREAVLPVFGATVAGVGAGAAVACGAVLIGGAAAAVGAEGVALTSGEAMAVAGAGVGAGVGASVSALHTTNETSLVPKKWKFSSECWYAGYHHVLEIHYNDEKEQWELLDTKHRRSYYF